MKALLAILLSSVTFLASAQGKPGYVTAGDGSIVKSGSGLCVHTGSYAPADAVKGCDPVAEAPRALAPMTLSGDALFDFDSAALTQSGRATLDQVIKHITATSSVTVVGHADRIGANSYNQRLSQQRAQAVADYLNAKSGFKAKFAVSGVGSSQPSGKTAACAGIRDFVKLKACLAPDRRVVITVK
jgi:OOP family OmpA-OmpF porin